MTAVSAPKTIKARPDLLRNCLALVLGSLLPLAFAPYALWPLAILLPALLIFLLQRELSVRQVFVAGWFFGAGYFAFGVYWVYNSLHDFGMAAPPVAAAITALLIAILALFPAMALACWCLASQRFGNRALWLLPLLWFGFEWLRGWILTGLPWLSLGYSQTDSALAGYAPLIGVYGIGALCVLMAIALVLVVRDRRYAWFLLLLAIPFGGSLLMQVEWTQPQGNPLRVTMVQGNIPQAIKWKHDQRQNIFDIYWRQTLQHWDSDLIVWPETALSGTSEEIEATLLQPMARAARENNSNILTGLVMSQRDEGIFYNSLMLLGSNSGIYHKRHLVIFGEYYPMRWLLDFLRNWINIPYSDLTPGPQQQPLMQVGDNTLGLSICFEDVFSRDVMLALPQANLLVNVSNDAWFGDSSAPQQHLQIAQMRSLESGRAMVRSTNTGVSAFIDHKGRILQQAAQFKTESLSRQITGRSGTTPFYYFAKIQAWLALIFIAVIFILSRRKTA